MLRYMVEIGPTSDWSKRVLNKCWRHNSSCLWFPQNLIALKRNTLEGIIDSAAMNYFRQCPLHDFYPAINSEKQTCMLKDWEGRTSPRKWTKIIRILKEEKKESGDWKKFLKIMPQAVRAAEWKLVGTFWVCKQYIKLQWLYDIIKNNKTRAITDFF